MTVVGWYYLHTNGDLIYKGAEYTSLLDLHESPFVRGYWEVRPDDREYAWGAVVEALAGGADPAKVHALAEEWGLSGEDGREYASRVNVELLLLGFGTQWRARPEGALEPVGVGMTVVEALADLARQLGYVPAKTGGVPFAELVHRAHLAART